MSIFFFVVGLEIKRQLVQGELQDPRKAALPAITALGGMVMPALIYVAFTASGERPGVGTSYAIIPLFALANAGVQLTPTALSTALGSRVTTGVMLGLVVGKVVGISGFAWLAQRLRLATLPEDVRWSHIVGLSAVAGIGFTVALFIGALAFDSAVLQEQAKVGILAGSALAAGIGVVVLRMAASAHTEGSLSRQSPI